MLDIFLVRALFLGITAVIAILLAALLSNAGAGLLPVAAWLLLLGTVWRPRHRLRRGGYITATGELFEQCYGQAGVDPFRIPRSDVQDVVARVSPPAFRSDPVTILLRLTSGKEIEIGRGSIEEAEAIEVALRAGLRLPRAVPVADNPHAR